MKTILVDAINTFVIKGEGIFKEMQKLLDTYPNKKIIVTNANDEQLKANGLNNMPYEVFTLKHNPDKPNQEYFKTLLQQYKLKPKNVVYFEHNEEAVKSAQSLGIKTFHYNKDAKDLLALKEFLDTQLR